MTDLPFEKSNDVIRIESKRKHDLKLQIVMKAKNKISRNNMPLLQENFPSSDSVVKLKQQL